MRKRILMIILLVQFNIYGNPLNEFFKNNRIELVIKKIPYEKVNENNKSHRYPFDEYYFSKDLKILKISYYPDKVWRNKNDKYVNNGFFKKKYSTVILDKSYAETFNLLFTFLKGLDLTKEGISFYSDELYLLELGNSKKQRGGTHRYSGIQVNRKKVENVRINSIYEVEIVEKSTMFLVASNEILYQHTSDEFIKSLIIINNLIDEIDNK
ncbi:hypothetical protein [Fusobacterium sp. PH5-44]|uniref:hypothetical protein n=1 Tax=unclassified Fusobacterium TaxID=2648384 RepID=UPI003D1D6FC6